MKVKYIVFFLLLSFVLSGCDYKYGSTTRGIRHSGFNLASSTFKCDSIFKKEKVKDPVKYYLGNNIITESGVVYQISLGKTFSNNMNCVKSSFKKKVSAVMDISVLKGRDNKLYYLTDNDYASAFSEITSADENYSLYILLLGDSEVRKVVTVNAKSHIYYVLKNDGNIYEYTLKEENDTYYIDTTKVVYDSSDYGSSIIDFNYKGNNSTTYIKTENSYYRTLITNLDECSKYVDVNCKYKMGNDKGLSEAYERILAYNGSSIITNYGKIFTVMN